MLRNTGASAIGWRSSAWRLSGSPRQVHSPTIIASAAIIRKIHRQPANSRTVWPRNGASTGTTMNTTMMVDIIRAIRSPPTRSRMIAAGSTDRPAVRNACVMRSAIIASKLVTSEQTIDSVA